MKSFIGKNTLYKILSIIKSDLTNNHNHDTRYYTEEEVNNLLQEQKNEILNKKTVSFHSTGEEITITEGYKDINVCSLTNLSSGFYLFFYHTWVNHYKYSVSSNLYLNNSLLCTNNFSGSSDERYWCRICGISASELQPSSIIKATLNIGLPRGESVTGSCALFAIKLKDNN